MSSATPSFEEKPDNRDPLDDLRAAVDAFDAADLVATAGALELIPANAERCLRLQAFAHAAVSLPYTEGLQLISMPRLRAILNGPNLESLAHAEDPFPNAFVEEVPYYGGSYAVLPGAMSGATFTFRHLCRAIFKEGEIAGNTASRVNNIALGCLRMSSAMLARAGLQRGAAPTPTSDGIVVPARSQLADLKCAVTFSRDEMEEFFGEGNIEDQPWSRLTRLPGSVGIPDFSFEDSPLLIRPIVQFGNTFIVSCPEALLAALNHHILTIITESGARGEFVMSYTNVNLSSVTRFMRYMGIHAVQSHLPPPRSAEFRERVFRCDSDKAIYALIVPDPLKSFRSDLASGGPEPGDELSQEIAARTREVEELLYASTRGLNELLCLVVHAAVGRSILLGFDETTAAAAFKVFPAHELETFALLNGGNRLALWRFCQQSEKLREKSIMVTSWSPLDEYGLYRKHKNSFYLTDDQAPNVVAITSDFSGALKREVVSTRDWHAVPHYEGDAVVEVTTLHGNREIPVYIPSAILTDEVAVFVEGLPFPLWILGHEEARSGDLRKFHAEMAAALGYWIWQSTVWINRVAARARSSKPVVISLWKPAVETPSGGAGETGITTQEPEVVCDIAQRRIDLKFNAGGSVLFNTADNSGERECLRKVLMSLSDVLGLGESEAAIAAVVDDVAPPGFKKMILLLNSNRIPQLDPREIPYYRAIQEGNIDDVLDDLGNHLTRSKSLPIGPVPDRERNNVAKDAVTYCYLRLQDLVQSHRPEGFLEFLILQHEAVIREDALRRLTAPTRMACFDTVGDVVKQLQNELPEIARAALASRFLIEYAVAKPPKGLRPISLGSLDEMRALADHITNFGRTSDALEYKLDDIQLAILKSGRLGRKGLTFQEASNAHMLQFYGEQIARSPEGFARNWRTIQNDSSPNKLALDLDEASSSEFGFTMTEISQFLEVVQIVGNDVGPGVSILPVADFLIKVATRLAWPKNRVNEAIKLFSLTARSDFLKPPSGFSKTDVYPWRFNRRLSYIRRPLLLRESAQMDEILWGNRHVESTRENLLMLCLTGRLKADSEKMRKFIGIRVAEQGKEFNTKVAEVMRVHLGPLVKERVKKIGRFRLDRLGDLDVLALDARRKRIFVVECKDLSIARTPNELVNEVNELLYGDANERSDIEKHQDRVGWVSEHINDVLRLFKLDRVRNWRVTSFLVTDQPAMTAYLSNCPVKVVTLAELKKGLPRTR